MASHAPEDLVAHLSDYRTGRVPESLWVRK